MTLIFPSPQFDDAVAAVCHDSASDEQIQALNKLLRSNAAARDEYIIRLELHSRLASEADLFASTDSNLSLVAEAVGPPPHPLPSPTLHQQNWKARITWGAALAACFALLAAGIWTRKGTPPIAKPEPTSKAVAMLNRTADAQWSQAQGVPRLNAPLEPGPIRLEAGLAQVVFYSGVRLVLEGPAELDLISENEAFCRGGRLIVKVPPQARGFRINTPHLTATDLGASFGLLANDGQTELHVFQGNVKLGSDGRSIDRTLEAGEGALIERTRPPVNLVANPSAFVALLDFQARSLAAEARRFDQWRTACKELERDDSLLVHFDFENVPPAGWQIPNLGNPAGGVSDATIVGCQWTEGRWPEKRALEFQSVNDRVRLVVPGEFESLTLSAWVSVKGLDRKINSLFMSDGFDSGTIHWLIRRDGVLGLTVIGEDPLNHQIVTSPPVVALDKFGLWLHLAVVLDSRAHRVVHYLNGVPVSDTALRIPPPYRIGLAELGNWNAKGFPAEDPFMIRNFSGAMDEFGLFERALNSDEIRALYAEGKPQGDTVARQ